MKYLIILLIILVAFRIIQNFLDSNENKEAEYNFKGKIKDSPLTKTEQAFYKKLKNAIDLEQYEIFPKLRLADIFKAENMANFNKIKSKHIDFTICNKDLQFVLFIELDDNSHTKSKNRENDLKKNTIFQSSNIEIMRIKLNEVDDKLLELKERLK